MDAAEAKKIVRMVRRDTLAKEIGYPRVDEIIDMLRRAAVHGESYVELLLNQDEVSYLKLLDYEVRKHKGEVQHTVYLA